MKSYDERVRKMAHKNKNDELYHINENKYRIQIVAFICLSVVTIVGLIGLFWGSDGYKYVGIGILLLFFVILWLGLDKAQSSFS